MSKTVETTVNCDLCETNYTTMTGELPIGWLKLKLKDPWQDRKFVVKDICFDCVTAIKDQS